MEILRAQRQVRTIYVGGLVGQSVSSLIWLVSALLATGYDLQVGAVALIVGGFFIYPLTQLALFATGRRASLPTDNPLRELAIEVALVAPLMLPLVGAAALYRLEWFYPAMMIAVGAHYLPFSVLYGMRHFLVLGGSMFTAGMLIGLYAREHSIYGAFLSVALLAVFAVVGWLRVKSESSEGPAA